MCNTAATEEVLATVVIHDPGIFKRSACANALAAGILCFLLHATQRAEALRTKQLIADWRAED